MVLWIASYPRSGNTLARIAIYRGYGVETRSAYGDGILKKERLGDLGFLFDSCKGLADPGQFFPVKTHAPSPRLSKGSPAIYIHRDGRDAIVSHAHFLHKTGKGLLRAMEGLVQGTKPRVHPWSDVVMGWADRPNTAYVSYEELVKDAIGAIGRCLEELGIPWEKVECPEMPTFEYLHGIDPTFFRNGTHGQWQTEMPEELQEAFWRRHKRGMEHYGYQR